ncbi:MAG TPA: hypothetical protein VF069_15740 [Streptosporangiaceae bacterium]
MGLGRKDLRDKVADKAGGIAAQAQAKAGDIGLSKERAAEVRDEMRAKGGKVLETTASGARQAVAGARGDRGRVAMAVAIATVIAVLIAGWRMMRRNPGGMNPSAGDQTR